ncbi:ABC transporter substrate-binding protein [Pseudoalteromonas aurantia]|uniref:ABC transporter substrate-binding protein n=1 Tax=Pseudoalteromonas aurantia TaxID=43654 RepID=A0A5S3VEJ0_9GAMM|nr:ABC transporter substrate-binding protein [Pseudoalteromonas aurantia]TMO56577.1 ABC transporter substrate-binding protein [Pseudoalteromonas aurantia]TMO70596.1 ABC transporter substrate-binding protein [Pseudoalteromonas aurantia]TMO73521.1 ABC transporter substrate-binding protein [Pseudoalteromonas aurantia]
MLKTCSLLVALMSPVVAAQSLEIQIASDYNPSVSEEPADLATVLLLKVRSQLKGRLSLEFIPASRLREWRELETHPNICLYNKVKTAEREAMAVFVEYPLMAFPANRLILRGQELPSNVSLKKIIVSEKLRIGVTKGRSYGKVIDGFIDRYTDSFIIGEGANSAFRLREMLVQGKLDGIIEYTSVFLNHHPKQEQREGVTFHRIDDAKATIFGYIACANSTQGRKAVSLFELALANKQLQKNIIDAHKGVFFEQEMVFIEQGLSEAYNIQP